MKTWITKALQFLQASLEPPKHELNELDWKAALSPDKKRLTEHLSAFANQPGGGFLVFGVDAAGTATSVDEKTVETTVNQLANLGRQALQPPVALDHAVEDYVSARLLFVHVPESAVKPVHLRGKGLEDAFIRSGGTTRRASRQEIWDAHVEQPDSAVGGIARVGAAAGHGVRGKTERRAHSQNGGAASAHHTGGDAGLDGGRAVHHA